MNEDKQLALQLAANLISTHMATSNHYKTMIDISMEVQSLADRLLEWLKS
jgi:hypothetical protein